MPTGQITGEAVRSAAIEALADVEGLTPDEVTKVLEGLDDDLLLELDSKKAEVMIAALEEVFGRDLPAPADLDRSQFSSFGALVALVAEKVVGTQWATS